MKKPFNTLVGWSILFVPGIIFFLFHVYPFFLNIFIAFMKYHPLSGEAQFVGLKNFTFLVNQRFAETVANWLFSVLSMKTILVFIIPLSIAYLLLYLKQKPRILVLALIGICIAIASPMLISALLVRFYSAGGWGFNPVDKFIFANPSGAPEVTGSAETILGLMYAIPLGTVLYLSLIRSRAIIPGLKEVTISKLFSQTWRLFSIIIIGCLAWSMSEYTIPVIFNTPLPRAASVFQTSFSMAVFNMKYDVSAAMNMPFLLVLTLCGLSVYIFLEKTGITVSLALLRKKSSSISAVSGRLVSTSGAGKTTRIILLIIAGVFGSVFLFLYAGTIAIPQLNSFIMSFISQKSGFSLENYANMFRTPIMPAAVMTFFGSAVTAFFSVTISIACGFVLGYLKPVGKSIVLAIFCIFLFVSPDTMPGVYLVILRSWRLLNTAAASFFPSLVSPFWILAATLLFRGIKKANDEKQSNALSADTSGMLVSATIFISLLAFSFRFVSLTDNYIMNFLTIVNAKAYSLSLVLRLLIFGGNPGTAAGTSPDAAIVLYGFILLVPAVLLAITLFVFGPRLLCIVDRNKK